MPAIDVSEVGRPAPTTLSRQRGVTLIRIYEPDEEACADAIVRLLAPALEESTKRPAPSRGSGRTRKATSQRH